MPCASCDTRANPALPAAVWRLARAVGARFSRDSCPLMAAALAYYGLLSLVPLAALTISLCGRAIGSSRAAQETFSAFLRSLLPVGAPELQGAMIHLTRPAARWPVELISGLGLLWAASRLFFTLEEVLTRIWAGHGRGRPLILRNLIALGAALGAGLLFLAITMITTAAAALSHRGPAWLSLTPWVRSLAPPLAAWLMFLLTYKFLPLARVSWPRAAAGALAATLLWELLRLAFALLLARSAGYGQLYGSLAGAVIFSLWIYATAYLLLIGAELAVVLDQGALGSGEQ